MAFTYFFRDIQIIDLAVKHLIENFKGSLKIWDAGCAMGQETYTIAIVLAEKLGYFGFKNNVTIHASDREESPDFGDIVRSGEYKREDLDRVDRAIFDKYFTPSERSGYYKVIDAIRERVIYQKHDLLSLNPIGTNFNLIICKNVLLHFQPPERIDVIKMFYDSLVHGGIFATEQTQKVPPELSHLFEQVSGEGQVFRKV